ncbi:hypothetical protein VHEMI09901 [[Torrubiella] hemipterigena]|uniref:Mitochondrial 2-oxoglutarate/malate carrier protein n=1 Tax=[Torrubiella] hemipterigena TaxID=1531966 RepID=A0A0A1THF5_9HYPO|nr:hypothetical protein VHEMI09901 [[Torrubiella] hemipterigena]
MSLSRDARPASAAASTLHAMTPFAVACGSGMIATICIQPIDTVKVRMQLTDRIAGKPSPWGVAKGMVSEGGLMNLYQGLSAGLMRQLVYGTLRLGLFTTFEQQLEARAQRNGSTVGFRERTMAGLGAGAIAAFFGNPTEVVLVRMQADGMKPLQDQQRYKSAIDALRKMTHAEGILSLWKGSGPTIIRAMSTNFGQLAFFSESKFQLKKRTTLGPKSRTAAAAGIAGLAGALISQPFDFVKTRLQNQVTASGKPPTYSSMLDCFIKVVRRDGIIRLYRDIGPYFLRIAPHS